MYRYAGRNKNQIAGSAAPIKPPTTNTACRANVDPASAITKRIRAISAPRTIGPISTLPQPILSAC
jgi:hypothetical protein